MKVIKQVEKLSSKEEVQKQNGILEEIQDICKRLRCTEKWFEMEDDNDLIEACIFQREELLAKYKYLMRIAKNDKMYSSPFKAEVI